MSTLLQDRTTDDSISAPKGRAPRRRRVPVKLIAAGVGVALLVPFGDRLIDAIPGWLNPFDQEVVDRSTPPLMLALEDIEEFHAATGTFQVVIDQERDTRYLPSVISGERVTFLATGSVDAYVDFADVAAQGVEMAPDRRSVEITLPAPQLGEATIDPDNSRVVDRDRGLLDRIGGMFEENPSSEAEFYALAEQRLEGAAADSDLLARAEDNTRDMLTALGRSMGFDEVTVTFEPAPQGRG